MHVGYNVWLSIYSLIFIALFFFLRLENYKYIACPFCTSSKIVPHWFVIQFVLLLFISNCLSSFTRKNVCHADPIAFLSTRGLLFGSPKKQQNLLGQNIAFSRQPSNLFCSFPSFESGFRNLQTIGGDSVVEQNRKLILAQDR